MIQNELSRSQNINHNRMQNLQLTLGTKNLHASPDSGNNSKNDTQQNWQYLYIKHIYIVQLKI